MITSTIVRIVAGIVFVGLLAVIIQRRRSRSE